MCCVGEKAKSYRRAMPAIKRNTAPSSWPKAGCKAVSFFIPLLFPSVSMLRSPQIAIIYLHISITKYKTLSMQMI